MSDDKHDCTAGAGTCYGLSESKIAFPIKIEALLEIVIITNVNHLISLDCNGNINIVLRVCNHHAKKSRRQEI
ncbi:hypothetical protein [Rhizobium leguminosarum]|uniref:hypothetical protein n=1 Tax=Rhizobium leguminosarum TaxID=384 RepID=UPI001C942257|nr:hypothetical protein [Rhizobium leguminosarum]MBY5420929.1 hypothetical protein [Rhizobium leguminosarum]